MRDDELRACPFCKEEIRASAVKCRFCGEWLDENPHLPISRCQAKGAQPTEKLPAPEVREAEETEETEAPYALPITDSAKGLTTATLLYLLLLGYFLVASATSAWTALAKDRARFSDGVIISTCLINTLIGFVERALLSPLGILGLAAYSYYVWDRGKTRRSHGPHGPPARQEPTIEAETSKLPRMQKRASEDAQAAGSTNRAFTQDEPPAENALRRTTEKVQRPGLKAAAVFLVVNAALTFLLSALMEGGAVSAITSSTLYRSMLFGDIICACALLSGRDVCRWYVVARTIYGAVYWGIAIPIMQGTALGWLTGMLQLVFLGGLFALVQIKGPSQLRVRWASAAVIIGLLSISCLNGVRLLQYQESRRTILAAMPWVSPEMSDIFLKEMISRNLNDAQFQAYFSTTLDKGRQQLALGEREEITRIYGMAFELLAQDDAPQYSSYAKKMRAGQPLTEASVAETLFSVGLLRR